MRQLATTESPVQSEKLNEPAPSIRVSINCLQVDPTFVGGVTTYVLGLLDGFKTAAQDCKLRVFVSNANEHLFSKLRQYRHFEVVVVDDPLLAARGNLCRAALLLRNGELYRSVSDFLFNSLLKLMESEADVLYTPTPVLRCFKSRRPNVLTMHDIQHLHHPEFFSWPRLLSRRITYELSARYADYFQASSEFIKYDLLAHFPWLSSDQVEVIEPGVSLDAFASASAPDCLARYDLPERFLFFPAQLWAHKNHITILKALKQVERRHGKKIPLVLTGAKFAAAPKIFRFIADQELNYVHYLGKVPLNEMIALYQRAMFMITATLHEASSFPILEAAAAGTPVICSSIPPFRELAGVLRLTLFNPLDSDELAGLIVTLWEDEKTRSAQVAHNRRAVRMFSWENAARKYVQLFRRAVNSFSSDRQLAPHMK